MARMTSHRIEIQTYEGTCPAYLYGDATAPSVLMYIDGIGMRPAIQAVAERLASRGYRVLLPDLFYRLGSYTAPEPKVLFSDPAVRTAWMESVRRAASQALIMSDTKAYLAHLPGKIGVTGYCMGGRMALAAAGTYPDRVVAAAAYHPGGLATDAPDSPHLLAANIKATVYVGAAMDDPSFPAQQIRTLGDALTAAHVEHAIEMYPARHGWVPSDTPVHDPAAAEKHYQTLTALLAKALA
jgi:carboxymethylenebutenolidase